MGMTPRTAIYPAATPAARWLEIPSCASLKPPKAYDVALHYDRAVALVADYNAAWDASRAGTVAPRRAAHPRVYTSQELMDM